MAYAATDDPDDYVIGTGLTHSVRDLVAIAFAHVDLEWKKYLTVDPELVRPAEVDTLCADASKARRVLQWEPTISFKELITMMVDADLQRLS